MLALHAENVSSYISYRVGALLHVHVSTTCFILHAAYFILHEHVPTINCLLLRTGYINLMSTTQLDRSRLREEWEDVRLGECVCVCLFVVRKN